MNAETLKAAEKAARRFLEACETLEKDHLDNGLYVGTRASGAVKRASMDLSRALSDLRRPG